MCGKLDQSSTILLSRISLVNFCSVHWSAICPKWDSNLRLAQLWTFPFHLLQSFLFLFTMPLSMGFSPAPPDQVQRLSWYFSMIPSPCNITSWGKRRKWKQPRQNSHCSFLKIRSFSINKCFSIFLLLFICFWSTSKALK